MRFPPNLRYVRVHEVERRAGRLGSRQSCVLRAMCEHGGWPGCGWTYGTSSETRRILDSLVKLGHVETQQLPMRDWHGRPYPESHPYHGRTSTSYRLAEKWRDVMSGKDSQHQETKEVAAHGK